MPQDAGLIVRMQSGFLTVEATSGSYLCRLRGRLKRGRFSGDLVALGDRVEISIQPDGTGMVEKILPRKNELARLAPTPRGEYRQILMANADQVLLVFACADPEPHVRMIDRFLVICEKQGVPAVIVANKADLTSPEEAAAIFGGYEPLGYPVVYTSARQGLGLDALAGRLAGRVTALTGPSGVGKSSLLNALQPGLGLAAKDVSGLTGKGRHTTVARQLFRLQSGGYVADMPGIRALALWDTSPEELDGYFPELRPLVEHCQFNDCTHRQEPGCAVRRAIHEGSVQPERYRSYLMLRYGEAGDPTEP